MDLSGQPTVAELLQRVKQQALEAQQHQDLPFEQVVEIVNPPRSTAHSPVYQVSFTWQSTEEGKLDLPGLEVSPVGVPFVTAKHDLSLYLGEVGDHIGGGIVYAASLFERSTIERYCGYLRQVLQAMVEDDSRSIATLPLLDASERQRLLVEWNATQAAYPEGSCIHELIEARAVASPQAVALKHEGAEVSYAELNARANRLARQLRKLGVVPDARVA
ncbi:condensation domain-containing protein, partial [Noviherbaspirillum sp. Root189]|uniref:condensation domain-containing protein n=1 Tax=Noviherbaspirillum sp. Root189 TaxID=1736487 RepID=UPI00070C313C